MNLAAPPDRVRKLNPSEVDASGGHVLYWMIAARRTRFNFALERATAWARELGRPLVILEALRVDYPWASDRFHRFVLDGMADNERLLAGRSATYYPYVEPEPGAGRGLLAALSEGAAVVVTDDTPAFFLGRMVEAASSRVHCRFEAVDSNGLLPIALGDREFPTAYSFRRFLQRTLPDLLGNQPLEDPLAKSPPEPMGIPTAVAKRWPRASREVLLGGSDALSRLPIDHGVPAVDIRGGSIAAEGVLRRFLDERLESYPVRRNRPEEEGSSGLSPFLHFGHLSSHQVFVELMSRVGWSAEDLSSKADGRRAGWWGAGDSAEAFLDQVVTWRELGFNLCRHRPDHDQYSALPEWARKTLGEHAQDSRDFVYDSRAFEAADTHDELWNAAQRQLVCEGRIHNYLRMLWGKKVLEWSARPEQALRTLFELNNRWALDGRDPNSSSAILWIFGRYDRAWGPERSVFGKVRFMSSANTARKVPVKTYLERYGVESGGLQ